MSVEKFIRGKRDSCHHEGRRSEVRRLAESRSQLKDYLSHERYYLEDRVRVPFSRTIPSEQRRVGIGDDGDGRKERPTIALGHEEAQQLIDRGAVFPLETAQPGRATFVTELGQIILPSLEPVTVFLDVQAALPNVLEMPKDIQGA